jgi:hypothetical protein
MVKDAKDANCRSQLMGCFTINLHIFAALTCSHGRYRWGGQYSGVQEINLHLHIRDPTCGNAASAVSQSSAH